MTEPSPKKGGYRDENLFQIIDGIIDQLNKTKRMFILMILSAMIIVPLSFAVTFAFFGPPYEDRWWHGPGPGPNHIPGGPAFGIARLVPIVLVVVWLAVGLRQWLILNKWTAKCEAYKELQKKIDEKLDFEKDKEGAGEGGGGEKS
ncbi:MAG: hypothetical protein ABI347_11475 [Nitrososphaera sp.]